MKRLLCLVVLLLFVGSPAMAKGRLALFGAYWDADDLGDTTGVGLRMTLGHQWAWDLGTTFYKDFDPVSFQVTEARAATPEFPRVESIFLSQTIEVEIIETGIRRFLGAGSVRPYVGVGIAYYRFESDLVPDIDEEIGFYGLVGIETNAGGRWGLLVEALYRGVEADIKIQSLPVDRSPRTQPDGITSPDFELDFSGPALNLGVVWRPGS